jgi:phenylalanyl-tRNA synthetase alpha chain
MSEAPADLVAALAALESEAEAAIGAASGSEALQQLRTDVLGRKAGRLTTILKSLPTLDPETRRVVGQRANAVKASIEQWLSEAEARLAATARAARAHDLTMPPRAAWRGAKHPTTLAMDRITTIFRELGFTRYVGPEVETEWHNFGALNFAPDHPAQDAHDTLYLGGGVLLRTHTSPLQIRAMQNFKPPIRILCPGMCYRKDPFDASHSPAFAQVEGLAVDEGITFVDLKATLTLFARKFFGPATKVRFRPSFFPFTEPSGEMDVECQICHGKGCATCKQTGWSEMLGCGMVDPAVFENVGIDAEKYTGWAFGMGPARMAQQLFGIADMRLLFEADVRIADQLVDAE